MRSQMRLEAPRDRDRRPAGRPPPRGGPPHHARQKQGYEEPDEAGGAARLGLLPGGLISAKDRAHHGAHYAGHDQARPQRRAPADRDAERGPARRGTRPGGLISAKDRAHHGAHYAGQDQARPQRREPADDDADPARPPPVLVPAMVGVPASRPAVRLCLADPAPDPERASPTPDR